MGEIEGENGATLGDIKIGTGSSEAQIRSSGANQDLTLLSGNTTNVRVRDNLIVEENLTVEGSLIADNILPIGAIIPWAGTTSNIPSKFLRCN